MAAVRRNLKFTVSISASSPPSHSSTLAHPPQNESSSTCRPPFYSRRRAKSAIMSASDPTLIASILRSSSSVDRATFRVAIAKLARSGRRDLVKQLLEPIRTNADANERNLVRVMALYSSARMIDDVIATFDLIPNHTEKSLCALLGAFLDNRLPGRARECFICVPREIGIVPGLSAWNLYLKALCEDGDVGTAAEFVLGKLHADNGIEPDIFSYNILLNAYLKKGDDLGFNVITEEISRKGLHLDVTTYNTRITMLCRKKNTAEAEKVFEEMLSKGIKPNLISYNTLLAGLCKDGKLMSAAKWFNRLRESNGSGAVADGGSYVMLMKLMVEKGEICMAMEMCNECLKKKWAPPFDVVRAVVDGLVKDSKVGEARKVVELMKGCVKGPALMAWIKFESTLPL